MRIAGYVRQTPGRKDPDSAFAQSERIRRWARDTGNELVVMCEDAGPASSESFRPGYRALLDVVRSSRVDAVVVGTLAALSSDKVLQEIMLTDLRDAGVTVIATDDDDLKVLADARDDHTRLVVRGVVSRLFEYRETFGLSAESDDDDTGSDESQAIPARDVVVKLIAPTG
jgi:DNA invertase Pin-like site-specific DNA recombinase